MRKPRKDMVVETRAKLIAAARLAFGTVGYAAAPMDGFTAGVGLTRGALYHHFGDKKGLLEAVVDEIDTEMCNRLQAISARASSPWQAVMDEWVAYIEMALEPEIQRIMFRDGPAVLGDLSLRPSAQHCLEALTDSLAKLKADGSLIDAEPAALARLINGASSHAAAWIASSADPEETSKQAVASFRLLLTGLLRPPPST
ncbi:TetR/AcrR family transcriptional regulator [Hydrogenophaga palleronii]|uniref:TetR/AcrR family transcriptional regulator n=1 Tax=Hydrogenophaga palleronii TaxID=65655 RepID=UPI0008269C28|nr:TetR/AcrR family transcriptional regulator [Hydrogenophaga palleronii]